MIRVLITGDFSTAFRSDTDLQGGDYNCLNAIRPYTSRADISVVNFESPIVLNRPTPIKKSGPNLYCTEKGMECLVVNGFNCITLANNHFFDQGQQGVEDTISVCRSKGVSYVGGGLNKSEARSILFKQIRDRKLAIINACEREFSVSDDSHGGSNPLDLINIQEDIAEARNKADYVVLILHGGIEHYHYPTPRMKRWYRHFVDLGADAVINHHQHCINGYEVHKGRPIFYGLGNFYFPWEGCNRPESWDYGFAVLLSLDERIDYELVPFKQTIDAITLCDNEAFEKEIGQLNISIQDDDLLCQKFNDFIIKNGNSIKMSLLPSFMHNRLFAAMARRGWLGNLYKGKQVYSLKNKLTCASHEECIQRLFEMMLK